MIFAQMILSAPALGAVEYELTKINGVLDLVSPYVGPPTPDNDVDAAWNRLTWNDSRESQFFSSNFYHGANTVLYQWYRSGSLMKSCKN